MLIDFKKHILFIITRSDDIGGAQIHVRDLALWLTKKNYKVTIIVGGTGYYIDHLRDLGLQVITCKSLQKDEIFDTWVFEAGGILSRVWLNSHFFFPK